MASNTADTKSLKELYLYENKIGDAGATALAPAFASMASMSRGRVPGTSWH
jgi:hypothetical protein